jgi:hypothetical protein
MAGVPVLVLANKQERADALPLAGVGEKWRRRILVA